MAKYVDGFVFPVQKKNLGAYRKMASAAGKIWMKCGALQYVECIGDDLTPNTFGMKMTGFPKMAKAKPGDVIVFSFIIYQSRAHRDKVNAKVNKDPFMNDPKTRDQPMPFDMKSMAYAGFKTIVDL